MNLKKLFIEKTENTSIQFFRYIFVGGISFIVDFSLLFALTNYLNLFYLVSAAIAFILGLITNYFLSVFWIFKKRKFKKRSHEFIIFAVIGIVGVFLNELIIWFFTDIVNLHYLISKIISTIIILSFNFFVRKKILF